MVGKNKRFRVFVIIILLRDVLNASLMVVILRVLLI